MLEVKCAGSPYEIGLQHGRIAKQQVEGSIEFYKDFFGQTARISWDECRKVAQEFVPYLSASWPEYLREMEGIANGAEVDFASILALNVRTEIAYGMAADGCTALSWKTAGASYIAQNWDWRYEQRANIIKVTIEQAGKPTISMMTEGGIIGKIGLNSAGVGTTLNAISAKGVSFDKLPVHLALRTVLSSNSKAEAQKKLLAAGVAAACHITIADAKSEGVGLECSAYDIVELPPDENGACTHSNHFIRPHTKESKLFLPDSPVRLKRINEIVRLMDGGPTMNNLSEALKDRYNHPGAICRSRTEKSSIETLFSIVMDLGNGFAQVKMGQPTGDGQVVELRP